MAELRTVQAKIHAISDLFTAVAAIRSLAGVLNQITHTIKTRRQPLPAPRPRMDA